MQVNLRINLRMTTVLAAQDIRVLAARLVERDMTEDEARDILSRMGVEADDAPMLVLSDMLSGVLDAFARMGASCTVADIQKLRQFFMGVLKWPPHVVMEDATLDDLADAFTGYCAFHGIDVQGAVSARFLSEMMNKFPDRKVTNGDKK